VSQPEPNAAASSPLSVSRVRRNTSGLGGAVIGALVSLVLGLASLLLLLRTITGAPALALGFLSLRRINAMDGDNLPPRARWARWAAIAGMVLGFAGIILDIVLLIAVLLLRTGEASRRATCADHLRRVGLAVAGYQQVYRAFPTATVDSHRGLAGLAGWNQLPYPERLSWYALILPHLEQQSGGSGPGQARRERLTALSKKLKPSIPWNRPPNRDALDLIVPIFLCPSHPGPDLLPAQTDYVGITGIGPDAAWLPKENPRAGFFGYGRRLRLEGARKTGDLPAGQSNTMMCAETMRDNGPWIAGGRPTARPLYPEDLPYIGYERQFGGMHPGGANILMVGGEVRFFSEQGSPRVFEALATLRHGEW
jgi:Protein of unknown function (DUF1559)